MAKGSFLSVKRGKIGDVVGYTVTNSNDKDKQGWRPYQPKVRNPQSDGQMVQRCKMTAVNNLYRALKEVITRGFENHKYGDESRRAWLKVALGQDFSTGPWMVKGSMQPVPIKNVPITVGSLPPVSVTYASNVSAFVTNILCDDEPTDVAGLSSLFIAAGYREGDQVTIMQGWVPLRLSFAWRVKSFYIDTTDTTSLSDLGISALGWNVGNDNYLDLHIRELQADALAIAVSRDGDGVNLRSTSYAATDPTTVDAVYYGDIMYEAAKQSYMHAAATRSTNWPIDPGTEGGGGGGGTVTAFTLSGTEIIPSSMSNVDAEPAKIVDANGQQYFVRAHTSAGGTRYLIGQGGSDYTSTGSAPTGATNANTVDPCAANNIASGCRAWLLSKGVSADLLVIE